MKRLSLIIILVMCFLLAGKYSFANEGKVVFGPQTYIRTTGAPNTFSGSFDVCDPTGTFTITVNNGDADGSNRISSGTISINGFTVVQQKDFNQNVATIVKPVYGIAKTGNVIAIKLQSKPGAKITVTVAGVMHCLEVHITNPANGSTITDYGTIIRGTIDDQPGAEVGVTVNGIPAEVNGKNFAIVDVPLQEGENTITASATDGSNETAVDSASVTLLNPTASSVYLTPSPSEGQAPLSVTFTESDSIPIVRTLYEMDYDGDGIVDASAQTSDALFSSPHVYSANGLYFPTITITDVNGNKYSKTTIVNVAPVPDLKAKWNSMVTALTSGDISGAAEYFSLGTRDAYQKQFQALKDAGVLAQAISGMGDMEITKTMGNAAEGDMRVTQDGKDYSFYVLFVKDEDGIWRIKSF